MRLALAAILVLLLVPAAATASTVSVKAVQTRGTYYVASYEAAPGEVNDLGVLGTSDGIVLTDSGAEIEPGPGCTPITDHSVTCTHDEGLASVDASLGDGEDHFTSEGPAFDVKGGPERDVLDGGEGGGTLEADGGDDQLQGGKTVTWFYGGDGADTMIGTDQDDRFTGGPGPDTIDGRGEFDADWSQGDLVSYEDHHVPVTVDLSKPGAPAGADGEGDTLTDVESVYGGQGPDTLTARKDVSSTGFGSAIGGLGGDDLIRGGPGNDDLAGFGGDDSVRGGGGDDRVGGQQGRDTLNGGGGSNEIESFDLGKPQRDLVRCGEQGSAYVGDLTPAVLDLIDQSCGIVTSSDSIVSRVEYGYVGRPTRAVRSTVTCLRRCRVAIVLRAHGKLLGSATRLIRIPVSEAGRGRSAKLTVSLTREARDELARAGVLRLGYSMDIRWGARLRHPEATSWHLLLHDPPAAR